MQDNTPLMRALSKLIAVNRPDLVLFVGEALVGNDAVDQLTKFNEALANHSNSKNPRLIDGIVLSKFDTIDDKGKYSARRVGFGPVGRWLIVEHMIFGESTTTTPSKRKEKYQPTTDWSEFNSSRTV